MIKLDRPHLSLLAVLAFASLSAASCSGDETGSPVASGSGGSTSGGSSSVGGGSGGGGGGPQGGAATTGGTMPGGGTTGGTPAATGGVAGAAGKAGSSGGTSGGSGGAPVATAGNGGAAGGAGSAGKGGSPSSAGSGGASDSAGAAGSNVAGAGGAGSAHPMMNFFVTSDSSKTGNLGGLMGADMRCQALAAAVGAGSKVWRAYLSTEEPALNARDRIGPGPYSNPKGGELAADKDALHARTGSAELFLDEKGNRINGQWEGSPTPNQHDILTGTGTDGNVVADQTCGDWTATSGSSAVGHSDGLGPGRDANPPYSRWVGSHTGQCGNTEPGGGAGKIYCFVGP
jgi:hypothetical protein